MSFEVVTNTIVIQKPVQTAKIKSIISTDVIVPDSKPDALNVLQVNAIASINDRYIQKDSINVEGIIDYTVLYSGGDEETGLYNIKCKAPFTQQIPVKGVNTNMDNYVLADVSHIEFQTQNSRKINLKSVITFDLSLIDKNEYSAISSFNSTSDIQYVKDTFKHMNVIACQESKFNVEDEIYLNNFYENDEILKIDCRINNKEIKVVNNKVIAKGSIDADILYTTDRDISHHECEIPFTEVIDVDNVLPDFVSDVIYKINKIQFDTETLNDENYLRFFAEISTYIKSYAHYEADVVCDAYSPDFKFDIKQIDVDVLDLKDVVKNDFSLKEQILLKESCPSVVKVYNVNLNPTINDVTTYDGYIVTDGNLNVKILYLTDDSTLPVYSYESQIPFSFKINSKDSLLNAIYDVTAELENSSFIIKSDRSIEIRANITLNSKFFKMSEKKIVCDMNLYEDEPMKKDNQSGITVYFADDGEKLWDVAKKYKSTQKEIAQINSLEENCILMKNQQLIIPKRIVG